MYQIGCTKKRILIFLVTLVTLLGEILLACKEEAKLTTENGEID
jgi:hypothetical protein